MKNTFPLQIAPFILPLQRLELEAILFLSSQGGLSISLPTPSVNRSGVKAATPGALWV